ncbi:amino acid adenylation domain-containing protein [Amycolatopsis sp. cg5]|uniref:amino acid adenylation domain-containing protein n=1 Tax=Amycolatopsis sp. cg5 TaxID=3238802 RepID=UPI0035235647
MSIDDRMAAIPEHLRAQLLARLAGEAEEFDDEITPVDGDGPLPLSSAQQRLWFMYELDSESIEYVVPRVLRLTGDLDVEAVKLAVNRLVARHASLRTTFDAVDGQGVQFIHEPSEVDVPVTETADLEAELLAEVRRPFDLRASAFRARLLRLGADDHVLVLAMHHIVTDGWSMGVLVDELNTLYSGGLLAPTPLRYADFAAWQRDQDVDLTYWKKRLDGLSPLELPTDLPRPAVRNPIGAAVSFQVPERVVSRLKAVGGQRGATLFMTLVAAAQVLLARYSGQADIAVGTATSGRTRGELENLVGFFVNTLVLRSTVDERGTFTALLDSVRETVLDASAHEDVPFQRLVEALRPDRDPSRPPLVDVIVNLQNTPAATTRLPGLRVEEIQPPTVVSGLDLAFDFTEDNGALTASLRYNTSLFADATAERVVAQLLTLLSAIAANPQAKLADLDMLTDRETLTRVWPGEGIGPETKTIPELFAEQVAADPAAQAVVFQDESLTYAELDERSDHLAAYLREQGAGPERFVGISLPRSLDMIVAVLAIQKAGAAYLPLDPDYPADRLRMMVEDANPILVLDDRDKARFTPGDKAGFIPGSKARFIPGLRAENAAYVIYTSGSTGRPKAVVVSHAGVHDMVLTQRERMGAGPGARVLQFASLSFDGAFWEIAMALLSGGTLVLATAEQRMPGDAMVELIADQRITHLNLPPTAVAALPQHAIPAGANLVVCGEACPPGLAEDWSAGRRMFNGYGPTESTVCATLSDPLTPADARTGVVSIGRPIPSVRTYVLDDHLRPAPVGVPGELYLAGTRLARGYLHQLGLTATRFVADPFGPPGSRMYRTGDRARWLADGRLEFAGRADDQVKLRGFRIELGEIEAVLSQHPEVSQAATAVKDRRLVGYLVGSPDLAELRGYLRDRLPEHMVPAAFVLLDKLPLTVNGKIDRRALPEPTGVREADGYVEPRTLNEKILSEVWAELLGVDRVGVHDNFFDLGGDSILGLQVVARARTAGLKLTPKQMFLRQTVAELATEAVAEVASTVDQRPVTGDVPLTAIQHWFFDQLADSADRFHQSFYLELVDGVDEAALGKALNALYEHHDALRLRVEDGRQYNAAPGPVELLTSFDEDDGDAILHAQRGFRLDQGPLMRALLFGGKRLYLVVHHLVVDGVSWRILLGDLDQAYQQASRGQRIDLGAKTTSFRDWAHRITTHDFEAERGYWTSVPSTVDLPVDGTGANTVGSMRSVTKRMDADALLRKVPEVYRTQVNDVLLSALARVLTDWAGGETALVELEGHGREELFDDVDLSRTVGWFTTMYPCALTLPQGDWGDVLKSVKEQLRAVPQHGIGHGYLGIEGPKPQVAFNYLGRMDNSIDGALYAGRCPDPGGSERVPHQVRQHLIEINSVVLDGRLELRWAYSAEVHHEDTIIRLADRLVAALEEIVEHCARPEAGGCTPSDFPLAKLDQATVDRLGKSIEDVYPLTPMQSGMLFHSLAEADADIYAGNFGVVLDGVTDPAVLAEAWQRVLDRTPALRTAVVWEDVPEPVQVVHSGVRLPITQLDWRGRADQAEALAELWADRAEERLDLGTAPLLRMTMVRLTDDRVQLFWTAHHLLADGWSFAEVLTDVFTEHAILSGDRGHTPAVRRPYRDYLAWLAEQDQDAAESYWRGLMSGFAAPTPLPFDRSSVKAHRSRSSRDVRLTLSPERSQRLSERARKARLTMNTLVQGAWAILLSRYTGERDVCFGSTVSGRPADLPGSESIVGLFINMVPVRVDVPADDAVIPWLRALQDTQVESRQYEYLSLAQIQGFSDVPRGTTLFDSIVVFENYPYDGDAAARYGLSVSDYSGDEHTNYALTLSAFAAEELQLLLGYDPELFDESTVDRMLGHLESLLVSIADDVSLGELELLTAPERERLLVEWNDTAAEFPPARLIHELFAEQAAAHPDAVAVSRGEKALTFADLDVRANRLAHHLLGLGAGPDVLVGVCVERGVEAIVALLAVLKSGSAFVPLDPDYPPKMLSTMLEDAAAPVVITQKHLADRVPGAVLVDVDAEFDYPDTAPKTEVTTEDLAYVVYTSGSTGKPKGVMVEHRHLCHMMRAWDARYGLTELKPRALSVSSLSVDLFFGDFVLSAMFGGSMIVCPTELVADPPALLDLIRSSRAELMVTVPTLAKALAAEGTLDTLKVLMVGSEGWPAADALKILDAVSEDTVLVNAYGATETTVDSTMFQVGAEPLGDAAYVPVGKPFRNTGIYVLDATMRPVPVGVAGECYIGGDGIARGYWNRPELSAERFLDNPFGPGSLYKTGDLVRWRADGNLECLGRADDQVKIRGFRVELGDVESVLARHPAVAEVAVAARKDDGPARLVGYIVPSGEAPEVRDLRAFASENLPVHAVPSAFVVLDALPLSPSGTVNRRALPAPDKAIETGEPYVAPRNDAETVLAEIWAEVLKAERVGVHDNFFDLGGDSILSIQVISRVRSRLGAAPSPRQLFDTPTVAGLAEVVEPSTVDTTLVRVDRDGPLPLSFAQQRLWFLSEFEPDSTEYNTTFALKLQGKLDVDALRSALAQLVERHEPLRTVFGTVDGLGVQVIRPAMVDLRFSEGDLQAEVSRPFDLHEGIFRATLFETGPDEHVLALVMHHIATDGWSMGILANELSACYSAALNGARADLPELPVQYADYAVWQREHLALEDHLEYWRGRLDGLVPLELPIDRPRPAVREAAGEMRLIEIAPELSGSLKALARKQDATLFMVLTAAVQLLLARYSGQQDITVGTATSGRNRAELEGLIGFFVNTVILRSTVDESVSFAELLGQVRDTALEAFTHEEVPFERLVEILKPERDPSRNALVEVMVGLETSQASGLDMPGLVAEELPMVSGDVSHDLTFDFVERQGELLLAIGYSTALFDDSTIARMTGHLESLLAAVVAEPDTRLHELPTVDLPAWHGPDHEVPRTTLAELFEQQAAATPDATAIVCDGHALTFAELNTRANQVAHHLISRDVGLEHVVGLSSSRSLTTVVAMLAVLKAGAAYLPLDPDLPDDRLDYMIRDAAPALVLDEDLPSDGPTTNPGVRPHPENPAYVIYTSGSTGKPKGVVIPHRGLTNLFFNHTRDFFRPESAGERFRVALTAAFSFDTSLEGVLAMADGHELHVIDDLTRRDPEALVAYVEEHRIDLLDLTPSYAEQLVPAGLVNSPVHNPKVVMLGGEAAGEQLWRDLRASGSTGYNFYGPTECTVDTLYCEVGASERPLIGKPVWNTQVYVLDRWLRPVPVGVPGDLYFAGAQLARGYLNRPALTAERFVADPFGPGQMYRTGDLARWTADGAIEYLGRVDDQVKVRGYRIELGEIEVVLAAHPGVAQATAVVRTGPTGVPRIVAYVTGDAPSVSDLRDFARQSLPNYMVPSAFVVLDEFPVTSSGKVDRNALPAPEADAEPDDAYVAPRSVVEATLAGVWAEVLGLERVGVEDNFFDLGGDSILSIQVVSKIRQAGLAMTSKDLFLNQTIARLGTVVVPTVDSSADQGPIEGPVPLVPIQRDFLDNDPVAPHHLTQSMLIDVTASADDVRAALSALVEHHDALRMRFVRDGDGWRQHYGPVEPIVLAQHDLAEADDQYLAMNELAVEADSTLDLEHGPLLRALLFDLGTRKQLFLTAHHLVVDGVSWRILLEDLELLLKGEKLAPKTSSFKAWAERLAQHVADGGFDDEVSHWTSLPETGLLPVDGNGPNIVASTRTVKVTLSEEDTEILLHQAAGRFRTRVNDVLLAGLASALGKWTGHEQVSIDLEGHGREEIFDDIDLSRTAGWFTTLYPVVLPAAAKDWPSLVKSVRRQVRAVPGNGLGYGALRYLGSLPERRSEVVFNYHGQVGEAAGTGPLGREQSHDERVAHLLEVVGAAVGGKLEFTWYYSENVHAAETVERVAADFRAALVAMADYVTGR